MIAPALTVQLVSESEAPKVEGLPEEGALPIEAWPKLEFLILLEELTRALNPPVLIPLPPETSESIAWLCPRSSKTSSCLSAPLPASAVHSRVLVSKLIASRS